MIDSEKEQIKKFIQSHIQFALATFGDYPWIATMYYGCDDKLNLYFLTKPTTIHAEALVKNPQVSAVIADSPQDPKSKKIGMQIYGLARELTGEQEIRDGFVVWRRVLDVSDPNYSYEGVKSGDFHYRLYILTPKKIKYYNEELWDEGDERVLEL